MGWDGMGWDGMGWDGMENKAGNIWKKIYKTVLIPLLTFALVLAASTAVRAATGYIETNKWAWGTNIGWINFNPTHGGVTVYDDHLEGYAWSENVGWIRLGTYEGGGKHAYANDAADTYGVNNDGAGNLSGYAWGTNIGWVNFNPTHGGVTVDSDTGKFDGYAWAENVGWINFKGASYQVVASSILKVLDSGVLTNGQTVTDGTVIYGDISQFTVEFTRDIYDPTGDTEPDDVTNPANYLLFQAGEDGVFDTISCGAVPGVDPNDDEISVGPVSYSNNEGNYIATVSVNNGNHLPKGEYRLLVCGSTSIVDLNRVALAGDGITSGTDWSASFTVIAFPIEEAALPDTGFARHVVTDLSVQPVEKHYAETGLTLEIPSLNVFTLIEGVPLTSAGWDVSWLENHVGYLEGSAFPTLTGNTVLTGHVWDANNAPGVFTELKSLKYGDQIMIHAWGQTYVYKVRERRLINSSNVGAMMQSEAYDWVTLITCEGYNPFSGEYLFRRMVRAVLVGVK